MSGAVLRLRAFVAVLRRDLYAQRMLPIVGALLGLLVPLAVFLPSVRGNDPAEVRDLLAATLAGVLFLCGLAGLAATTLARDYVTGRIGFYFARPIPASSLWLGKIGAALLAAASSAVAVILPTALLGGSLWRHLVPEPGRLRSVRPDELLAGWRWEDRFSIRSVQVNATDEGMGALLLLLFLVAVAYLVGLSFQLNGLWTLGDFAVVGILALVAGGAVTTCLVLEAERALEHFILGVLGAVVAAAVFGGWAAIRLGGRVPARAHGAQSLLLWLLAAAAILPAAWKIEALRDLDLQAVDMGRTFNPVAEPWVVVKGRHGASGTELQGLWNVDEDRWIKLPIEGEARGRPLVSPDGEWVAFSHCPREVEGQNQCDVQVRRLTEIGDPGSVSGDGVTGGAAGFGVTVGWRYYNSAWAAWAGSTLAVYNHDRRQIQTYRFPGGRPSHTLPAPEGHYVSSFHTSGTVLRYLCRPSGMSTLDEDAWIDVYEVDLSAEDGVPQRVATWPTWTRRLPGRGGHLLKDVDDRVRLVNLDADLSIELPPEHSGGVHTRLLSDGRILQIKRHEDQEGSGRGSVPNGLERSYLDRTWILLDAAGVETHRFSYPYTKIQGAEVRPGVMMVGRFDSFSDVGGTPQELARYFGRPELWRTDLVDLDTGHATLTIEGFLPLWCEGTPGCPLQVGDFGSDWLVDPDGRPHRLDFETGAVTPLLGKEG